MERHDKGLEMLSEMLPAGVFEQVKEGRYGGAFAGRMMEMVVSHVYGEIWSRPGLDRRARSLVTLGMLIAQNAEEELEVHLRMALNNGCTVEEIEEVLYQATAYVGFPAAMSARRVAGKVVGGG